MARKTPVIVESKSIISPEEFERFLGGLVMRDVCIERSQFEVVQRVKSDLNIALEYGERAELISSSETEAIILASYAVRVVHAESNEAVAHLQATYRVVYGTGERMSDSCFDQLRRFTLRIHTVPFAREWFREASARMGLDPIMLPLSIAHPAAIPNAPVKKAPKTKE